MAALPRWKVSAASTNEVMLVRPTIDPKVIVVGLSRTPSPTV